MAAVRAVAAVALVGAAVAQPTKNCFEKYQCIFHHDVGGQEYSWDLHQLCHEEADYVNHDDSGHTTYFKICGNASQTCAPNYPTYDTHGVAIQIFDESFTPCNASSPKDCTDYDYGVPTCCTGQCYILGTEFFQFYLLDDNNLNKGVKLVHSGMPSIAQDPFKCPPNTNTLLDTERQIIINILCDSSVSKTDFAIASMTENQSCIYTITGSSGAACATKGDPYDIPSNFYRNYPPDSFGFVVLGSVITIIVMVVYSMGDARGWWDPIKRIIPPLPSWWPTWLGGGGGSGGYKGSTSGSSKYSTVGGSSSTPITASAYGTA